ncbi:putative inorganic phosphate cotransporter isoform X2 [Rhodnius prolixus]
MVESKMYLLIDDSKIQNFGVRHFQAFLLFLCFSANYLLTNSVEAYLKMAVSDGHNNTTTDYNRRTLSSDFFQYAFIGGSLLAGYMGTKMNNKILLLIGLSYSSITTFFLPYVLYYGGYVAFVPIRTSLGVAEGFALPMIIGQIARWFPLYERAAFTAFIFGGRDLGVILLKMYMGLVNAGMVKWPSMWFFAGTVGLMVSAAWGISGAHDPGKCYYINEAEKIYITEHCVYEYRIAKKHIKWGLLLTNVPFYALLILHVGYYFGFRLMLYEIPTYLYRVYGLELTEVGIVASVPHITALIFCVPVGFVADLMIRKRLMGLEFTRKLFSSIGMFGCAFCIVSYAFASDQSLTIFMNSLATSLTVFVNIGLYLNHVDIAPNFACLVMGFSSVVATITGIILPELTLLLISDVSSAKGWEAMLFMTAGIYTVTNVFFLVYGSSDVQNFNLSGSSVEG